MSKLRTMVLNLLLLRGSSTVQLLATDWRYDPILLLEQTGYLVLEVLYNSWRGYCTTRSREYCRVRVHLVHCTVVENTSHTTMFEVTNIPRRDVPCSMWSVIGSPKKGLCDKQGCQVEQSLTIPKMTNQTK
jgi:hypothetical protein